MSGFERRFSGIGRLYGLAGLEKLRRSHVCVVGVGGVGSWAVEALARSAVGQLTLVDLDDVCISNVNRQLPALNGTFGQPKVEVLAQRVQAINPECQVHPKQCFFVKSNAREIITAEYDFVLDAIDNPSLKALLIATCREAGVPVLVSGGAGGRRDPTAVTTEDLAFSSHDRLLQVVRKNLRKDHGFPRGDKPFGISCVLSREQPVFPTAEGSVCTDRSEAADLRLDCRSGFGTASFVTGTFGLVAASRIVAALLASEPKRSANQSIPNREIQPAGASLQQQGI